MDFRNRTAVITGAASGIGFGLAEAAVERGMSVVLADVEAGALKQAEVMALELLETATGVLDERKNTLKAASDAVSAFTQGTARNVRLGERVRVVYRAPGFESLERTYDLFSLTEPRTLSERLQPTPGGPVSRCHHRPAAQ